MIKGFVVCFLRIINKLKDLIVIVNKVIKRSEVIFNFDFLVIKIFKLRSIMIKRIRFLMLNLFREIDLDLVLGVFLIRNSVINEIIIDRIKI